MSEGQGFTLAAGLVREIEREGLVSAADLKRAEEARERTREPLGTVLVNMGLVSEEKLLSFLSRHLNIPQISLKDYLIDPEIVKLVPERIARQHRVMPLFRIEDTLTVAVADPMNVMALDSIRAHTGGEVEVVISNEEDIREAINQHYGEAQSLAELVESVGLRAAGQPAPAGQPQRLHRIAGEPPVVRLVNMLLLQAISGRASDVHLEPTEKDLRVRFRVDGILAEHTRLPKSLQLPVSSRLKVMADINISERRVPQDGRIELRAGDKLVDLRVATYPSIHGEKIAVRILDKSTGLLGLEDLGFGPELLERVGRLIKSPFGLTLSVGPTGSGKTTTLYAILREAHNDTRNTMTIEDPVEYQIDGVTQAQVNPQVGVTFSEGLRAIVRQDPDVIMIGEIRDLETAEIAVRAALTGHQVFSTLHTTDAASTPPRLIDMGVDPYLIASSLNAVVSQRLVRRVCTRCREEYVPSARIRAGLGLPADDEEVFYRGKGCSQCGGTGYRGRIGLFEVLPVDAAVQELIMARRPAETLSDLLKERGLPSLRDDGVEKVRQGLTTVEEVLRATFGRGDD